MLEGVELPGGLKIVGRHVDAAGKVIDFALQDASGARALLEVKAWNTKRWTRELAAARARKPRRLFVRMIEQLKAAKSTGQPVYLAVSDAIDAIGTNRRALLDALVEARLESVKVVTMSEGKLREVSSTLRKGLAMSATTALVMVDQIDEEDADD